VSHSVTPSDYPKRISRANSAGGGCFTLSSDHVAVRSTDKLPQSGEVVMQLGHEGLVVVRGLSTTFAGGSRAVYVTPDGGMVVPTGRVFVRFAEGTAPAQRAGDLRNAGYEIVGVPAYAPQAAWVQAINGSHAAALRGIESLRALVGVENAEPEMLSPAARR
jgi:hypothetical protein